MTNYSKLGDGHRCSILASGPAALCVILGVPNNFLSILLRFIDSNALTSGQGHENVNRTHLALACGKPLLHKKFPEVAFAKLKKKLIETRGSTGAKTYESRN